MVNAKKSTKTKTNWLFWTDNEVKLLLQVTLDYKSKKIQEGVDWESCKSKYDDIKGLFEAQYPKNATEKDFPHNVKTISREQVLSKVKNSKRIYKKAVEAGRLNGRVMLLYYELCEQIWGGSPNMQCIDAAIETSDQEGIEDLEDSYPEAVETADSEPVKTGDSSRRGQVWSDNEVKLLLQVAVDYKSNKVQEGVDWESCKSKYEDIKGLFEAQYPKNATEKDFPRDTKIISTVQVTSKLKNIKRNYRKAVEAGRRSGNGRVVQLYFELCEQLWGGSPATQCIDAAIETSDQEGIEDLEDSSPESVETADSEPTEAIRNLPPAVVKHRRDLLQAELNNHGGERLKRRVPDTPLDQEDLQIKRRMEEKKPGTFSVQTSTDFLVWTDNEVKLLLQVAVDYKSKKIQEGVEWESCKSRYKTIKGLFETQYPKNVAEKDFPHDVKTISREQIVSKLKNIKRHYRKAVDTGRRSGNGRVVQKYFELCEQLWGGSPAMQCVDATIETSDQEGIEDLEVGSSRGQATDVLVWTDSEVKLLLQVTLDYKSYKIQEGVNWESCRSKYDTIKGLFEAQYPKNAPDKDFPHDVKTITRGQVTSKLKTAKINYRKTVDTGRTIGRVVQLYFELCEQLWGDSPATQCIDAAIETSDQEGIEDLEVGSSRGRATDFLVWSDNEVKLLLQVAVDYKSNKIQEGVDWESCKSKYEDIKGLFEAQYPKNATEKDFPQDAKTISTVQVTSKLKNIKRNYRMAVEAGRRSGNGRAVRLYFELCEQLWGGSPATQCTDAAIETSDQEGIDDLEDSSPESAETADSEPTDSEPTEAKRNLPPSVVKQCRDLLQAKRKKKRKVLANPSEQEDLQIKRRMLELMEENSRRNYDNIAQINKNIGSITNTIQDGISLMRELFLQPNASNFAHPHSSSIGNGRFQGHQPAFMHSTPHPSTPAFRHTPTQHANTHNHMPPQYTPTHATPQQSFTYE